MTQDQLAVTYVKEKGGTYRLDLRSDALSTLSTRKARLSREDCLTLLRFIHMAEGEIEDAKMRKAMEVSREVVDPADDDPRNSYEGAPLTTNPQGLG